MSGTVQVATFERVSSDGQDVANQRSALDAHCGASGYEVAKRFVLPDTSAYKGKHAEALAEILADVAAGQYTRVIAVASSRFERRGVKVGLKFCLDLDALGGRLESCDNPTFGDMGNLAGWVTTIVASDADNAYSANISRNVNRAFRRMDDNGAFRGQPPAGYEAIGDKRAMRLVPAADRREVTRTRKDKASADGAKVQVTVTLPSAQDIRQAFADAPAMSTVKLGARLGMTADAVANLLRNKVYSSGMYEVKRADGVTTVHRCESLVTPEVQARAVEAMARRKKGDNTTSRALVKDDFSGALRCGSCERGAMHRYYNGARKRNDGSVGPRTRRYGCDHCGKSVSGDAADAALNALMSARRVPYLEWAWVDGDNGQADLDRVAMELRELAGRGLDRRAEQAERERLWAEQDRLEALPRVTGHWGGRFSGMTEGARWDGLTTSERRAWCVSGEFRVYASARPGRTGAVDLAHVSTEYDEAGAA